MPQRRVRYSGELARPLPARPQGLLSGKGDTPFWNREYARKLVLLVKHYGLDPFDKSVWFKLARALAEAHVLGFSTKPIGRPEFKSSPKLKAERAALLAIMERLQKRNKRLSEKAALKKIRERFQRKAPSNRYAKLSLDTALADIQIAKKERKQKLQAPVRVANFTVRDWAHMQDLFTRPIVDPDGKDDWFQEVARTLIKN